MNELQVIVKQEPGTISWNFEELKTALMEQLSIYKNTVYDDNSIAAAKADTATLRKLRKAVEDKRKEVKVKCLEPYAVIEAQAKELVGIIDEPINFIAEQVSAYEEQQRAARKARIMEYMADMFKELPPEVQKKAQLSCYDVRWENATAKVGEWKKAIEDCRDRITRELGVVGSVDEDFRKAVMEVYCRNLDITAAMAKAQEMQSQKELLIERQRQREEAMRRQREAEERRRAEELERRAARLAADAQADNEAVNDKEEEPVAPSGYEAARTVAPAAEEEIRESMPELAQDQEQGNDGHRICIYADAAQYKKILGYIEFVGASWQEV